jgi:dUTP pyrophosphatase
MFELKTMKNMNNKVQFTKIRDVKSPRRANTNDAGMDFFIPNFSNEFFQDLAQKNVNNTLSFHVEKDENGERYLEIVIPAHSQVNIPSGIRVNILDKNTFLLAQNKSGVATKYRLVVGACVVDADYQGEVHLNMINTSDKPIKLRTGQKIVQFIHLPYIKTELEEITNEQYESIGVSDRGTGGFASSGEK